MNKNNSAVTNELINSLKDENKAYLKEIFQSKRIRIQHKGEQTTVARRIIKPKTKAKINITAQ